MNRLPGASDYIMALDNPQLIKAAELKGGKLVRKNGNIMRYAGGFCIVFPYLLASGRKVAVRCWTAHVQEAEKRSRLISQKLKECGLSYFVNFDFVQNGLLTPEGICPVVLMDWVDAQTIKDYIKRHVGDESRLRKLADDFKNMVADLHKVGLSHGDMQHGNIMVSDAGQLFLVDYDSMFVPGLEGLSDEIKGLAGYQHPARNKQKCLSPKADYFSELVIYSSILAIAKFPALWNDLNIENTETMVFSQDDLNSFSSSAIRQKLSGDSELKVCVDAIRRALSIGSIDQLVPLEEALIPPEVRVVSGLRSKWQQSNNVPKAPPQADVEALRRKWSKR